MTLTRTLDTITIALLIVLAIFLTVRLGPDPQPPNVRIAQYGNVTPIEEPAR